MRNYEVKDKIIKAIASLRENEILQYGELNNNSLVIRESEISEALGSDDIDGDIIMSVVRLLFDDNLLKEVEMMSLQKYCVSFNSLFFDALDSEQGWYTTLHYKEKMELEKLVSELEKLSIEIKNLENSNPLLKDNISNIGNLLGSINTTIELISKCQMT